MCGEKIEMPYELLLKEGSPPRMRGKAMKDMESADFVGITPAYAGKSSFLFPSGKTSKDHPRACGEK